MTFCNLIPQFVSKFPSLFPTDSPLPHSISPSPDDDTLVLVVVVVMMMIQAVVMLRLLSPRPEAEGEVVLPEDVKGNNLLALAEG